MWKEDTIELNATRLFEQAARILLSLLIIAILLVILAAIGCTFYDIS